MPADRMSYRFTRWALASTALLGLGLYGSHRLAPVVAIPHALVFALVISPLASVVLFVLELGVAGRRRRRRAGYRLTQPDQLSGEELEEWLQVVLEDADLEVERIGGPGDFGIDLVVEAGGRSIGVQAKRKARTVGNRAVQQAIAGADYHGCELAVVVTQSRFCRAAWAQAEASSTPILLVEGASLASLTEDLMSFVTAHPPQLDD